MFQNILQHPKTSIAGLLIGVLTVVGVLSQQGITLGHVGTGTGLALLGGLATAFLGLISKDPGASDGSGVTKVGLFLLCAISALTLSGCPSGTAVHKASAAAATIGDSLATAASVNHEMIAEGEESAEEGAQVATYIEQAALANDAFVAVLKTIPDNGSRISAQQALTAFSALQTQVTKLNSEGVLHLKSQKAQQAFATAMTTIQGSITAIELVIAAHMGSTKGGGGLPLPALPLLCGAGLLLAPTTLDELTMLALALVGKIAAIKGKTAAELLAEASASDAEAEQQAAADGAALPADTHTPIVATGE